MSVRGNECVNGCPVLHQTTASEQRYNTYHNVVSNTEIVPENTRVKGLDKEVSFLV
jgi:hypothetical protein